MQPINPLMDPTLQQPSKENLVFNGNIVVVVDSMKSKIGLEVMAKAIAKSCNFNYIPSVRPFSEGKFLLFCKTQEEASAIANLRSLRTFEATVFFNKFHKMVNVV